MGDIEFFGYKGIDVQQLKRDLPVHPGDPLSHEVKQQLDRAIEKATGHPPSDIGAVCCDEQGQYVIFIGLSGRFSTQLSYNAQPKGSLRVSEELSSLHDKLQNAVSAAVQAGGNAAQEDDSHGYALANYPPARSLQLAMRAYAIDHEKELMEVLERSSDPDQRRVAATALGYSKQSPEQLAALVRAARDPDEGVRNNATRAILVLASSSDTLADEIPPNTFIQMMSSGIWTDRNKAVGVLLQLTRSRNPKLLAQLKTEALEPLVEMAKWRDTGHALPARIVLGRMAGVPEKDLMTLAMQGSMQSILAALGVS